MSDPPALPGEFSLIVRHFAPLAGPGGLDLTDDAAVLAPPPERDLVVSADTMVAGVHFFPSDPANLIARKLLRVNLSDLAAMGAAPLGYVLCLSVPKATPDSWFALFAAGLAEDQRRYGLVLLGGDITSTPGPISLSLTVFGSVAAGAALRRMGAKPGDGVWVSGTIGDAALGLAVAQGRLDDPSGTLLIRYRLPEPRLGLKLAGIAHAGLDVSDGLVQDLGHLCRLGGLGAEIEAALVPASAAAAAAGPRWLTTRLTGGDDYELLLAVPPEREAVLIEAAGGLVFTRIGRFFPGPPLVVVRGPDGAEMLFERPGFSHFS